MNETVRRILMMFGIILVGSVFIFFDASVPIIIGGTIAFGIILIMGLGLLTLDDIRNFPAIIARPKEKPSKQAADTRISGSSSGIFARFRGGSGKKTIPSGKASAKSEKSRDKHSPVTGLVRAIDAVKSRFIRSRDSSHGRKIDELLDTTIHEPVTTTEEGAVSVQEESVDEASIPDLLSNDFDDDDFGLLDDLDLDDDYQNSMEVKPAGISAEPVSLGDPVGAGDDAMMSIDAILAGHASFGDDVDISGREPDTDIPGEKGNEFGSIGDFDDIEVDGGIISLDDDLAESPFSGSAKPAQSGGGEETFSFGFTDDTNTIGFSGSDDSDEDAFGGFSLDDLDLEGNGSLDDLELDIVEEEEEIDSIGLLPDDVVSEDIAQGGNAPIPDTWTSKKEVINFGGYGDSTSDEIMSFGGGDDDGLMSMLKTDIKKKKSIQDASLVRDMKDANVDSQDLIEGLEDVLKKMGGKPSLQTNDQNPEM